MQLSRQLVVRVMVRANYVRKVYACVGLSVIDDEVINRNRAGILACPGDEGHDYHVNWTMST